MDIKEELEGHVIPRAAYGLQVQCDYCRTPISVGDKITLYASNRDYGAADKDGQFVVDRCYGVSCCRRTEIQFPLEAAAEALFLATVDDGYKLRNVKLVDKSMPADGIAWDPPNMWKLMARIEIREYMDHPGTSEMTVGPEDVYDTLLMLDVDAKELVNEDGYLTIDDDEISEYQEQVDEKFIEKANEIMRSDS